MFIVVFSTCYYVCKSLLGLSREKRESTSSFLSSFFLEVTHTHTHTPVGSWTHYLTLYPIITPSNPFSFLLCASSFNPWLLWFLLLFCFHWSIKCSSCPIKLEVPSFPLCHKNVFPPDSCFGLWIWCSLLCVCPTNFIVFSLSLDAFFSEFFFSITFIVKKKKKKFMCLEYHRV